MIKIKQFHFPSLGITLHNITGICEARWTNGQFTNLGLHHGQDHLFEASEIDEATEREFKRLKLVLQVAHGDAKARYGGMVFDRYDSSANHLCGSVSDGIGHLGFPVDDLQREVERYEEPEWVTIHTLEDALQWLGATVDIKYAKYKPETTQISEVYGTPNGRVHVQTAGRRFVTFARDSNPIQVRGKRHPNNSEIVRKWRELHNLIKG